MLIQCGYVGRTTRGNELARGGKNDLGESAILE